MQAHASPLLRIPVEILERIGLEVALLHPLGPPVDLIALLCTCNYVHHTLSFHRSKDLYAKIFRAMFDVDAPRRRFGRSVLHSRFLASQLKTYCITLQRIRRGDIFALDVEDVLRTAFIILTENDGKNRAQLEWANTYDFVSKFVRHRLWQDTVNGWPRDTPLHSLALWVMWSMTDGNILAHETQDDRNDLITLVLPYVVMAFKVCLFYLSFRDFLMPYKEWDHSDLVSLRTAHGEYPIFPARGESIVQVNHFGRVIRFCTPPITAAAKLIYFSRRETIPLGIPPMLPVDRPAALAQGITWGQTQADIIEVNSHAGAQFVPASHWDWKSTLTPEQRLIEEDGTWRRDLLAPSAAWDNDWERFTTCWDPWANVELKGTVYTFGSMDGLWQGRLLIPDQTGYLALVSDPNYPEHFGETSPFMSTWPFFMRLKEHHCISPQEPVPPGGSDDDPLDDGIRNAWFPTVDLVQHGRHTVLTYRREDEIHRTEHETYEEGQPNSHNEDACLTCQSRRERGEQPTSSIEDGAPLRHSDYENEFAEAGLGRPSFSDDEEDTYDTTCIGIRDIIFTGETDLNHGMAWGRFTFLGRVRPWDGLIAFVRLPTDPNQRGRSRWVFRGYLHYGKVLVGSWRGMTMDVASIPWEGPFVASKRA
ncbi:hypothetical protein B0F90DRAFT_1807544 [Multifurca ochricompacta]|uniref:F-box domain-containing protein n=1 Tax=Multifurca ochricompacta TaxID=376703 RepID=A0AAD4QUC7_9AGAM|nr:hypothetical protein B0F90DRAFT_1807544 [Multifurca ochricompacta]